MSSLEGPRKGKPYVAPVLIVHGDVKEVTQAVNSGGRADNKSKGTKTFRTA